jgi:hypothetical protein
VRIMIISDDDGNLVDILTQAEHDASVDKLLKQAQQLTHALSEWMVVHNLTNTPFEVPYTVVDTFGVQPGQKCKVLGHFYTEEGAAQFISTLPDHESGRYGLDGPEK